MGDRKLRIEEVAVIIGVSAKSINTWYRFAREFPDNEVTKLLPPYTQEGARKTRYWNESDVWRFIEFKNKIPLGRNGIMGQITQRYYKRRKQKEREAAVANANNNGTNV